MSSNIFYRTRELIGPAHDSELLSVEHLERLFSQEWASRSYSEPHFKRLTKISKRSTESSYEHKEVGTTFRPRNVAVKVRGKVGFNVVLIDNLVEVVTWPGVESRNLPFADMYDQRPSTPREIEFVEYAMKVLLDDVAITRSIGERYADVPRLSLDRAAVAAFLELASARSANHPKLSGKVRGAFRVFGRKKDTVQSHPPVTDNMIDRVCNAASAPVEYYSLNRDYFSQRMIHEPQAGLYRIVLLDLLANGLVEIDWKATAPEVSDFVSTLTGTPVSRLEILQSSTESVTDMLNHLARAVESSRLNLFEIDSDSDSHAIVAVETERVDRFVSAARAIEVPVTRL